MAHSWLGEAERLTLASGEAVTVRHIRPADEPLLARFHTTLSGQSVYLRCFTPLELSHRVDHARLARICRAEGDHDLVLLVRYDELPARGMQEHETEDTAQLTI